MKELLKNISINENRQNFLTISCEKIDWKLCLHIHKFIYIYMNVHEKKVKCERARANYI